MQIGIVGKPSCGKSTFFKAATMIDVAIAAYPFTTIKPNIGIGYVQVECVEKEFNVKCNPRAGFCIEGIRYVPVELIDVAGLVPGAHKGKGLGNQFLNDLNQADVLIHVVDISGSTNEKGEAVSPGSYNPANDIRFLEYEIDMWFYDVLQRNWQKIIKLTEQQKDVVSSIVSQLSAFRISYEMVKNTIKKMGLDEEKPKQWDVEQLKSLATGLRTQAKPIVIACNKIDVADAGKNFERIKKEFPHLTCIPCSAEAEVALRTAAKNGLISYKPGDPDFKLLHPECLSPAQQHGLEIIKTVLQKYGSTGIQQALNVAVFDFLKYIAIFPGGVNKLMDSEGRVLPDCFLMPLGSTALDFARKIHSDLAKHFLYAINVRTKMRLSADYKLKHRDVIEIVSAAR